MRRNLRALGSQMMCERVCAEQDRFEERWAQQVAPRIAEVDALMKVEEEALRQRIAEASVRLSPNGVGEVLGLGPLVML